MMIRLKALRVIGVLLALGASQCSSEIVRMQSVKSPDGSMIADYYLNSGGGAASAVGEVVSLRMATDEFHDQASHVVFGAIDADPITVRWISDRELEITHRKDAFVNTAKSSWRQVAIKYVAR